MNLFEISLTKRKIAGPKGEIEKPQIQTEKTIKGLFSISLI